MPTTSLHVVITVIIKINKTTMPLSINIEYTRLMNILPWKTPPKPLQKIVANNVFKSDNILVLITKNFKEKIKKNISYI